MTQPGERSRLLGYRAIFIALGTNRQRRMHFEKEITPVCTFPRGICRARHPYFHIPAPLRDARSFTSFVVSVNNYDFVLRIVAKSWRRSLRSAGKRKRKKKCFKHARTRVAIPPMHSRARSTPAYIPFCGDAQRVRRRVRLFPRRRI